MTNHLEIAKLDLDRSSRASSVESAVMHADRSIAHALIAIAERSTNTAVPYTGPLPFDELPLMAEED